MMTALSASSFSTTTLNDLTSGSCELVTGSKSIGPTSPFGVWSSAFAHRSTSDFDRYFAFAALALDNERAAAIALALCRTGIDGVDDGNGIVRGGRCAEGATRYRGDKQTCHTGQNKRSAGDHGDPQISQSLLIDQNPSFDHGRISEPIAGRISWQTKKAPTSRKSRNARIA